MSYDPKFPLKAYRYKGYSVSPHGEIWGAFDKNGMLVATGQNPSNCQYELDKVLKNK